MFMVLSTVMLLFLAVTITLFVKYYRETQINNAKMAELKTKYELEIADATKTAAPAEAPVNEDTQKTLQLISEKASLLEKNVMGGFDSGHLITNMDSSCINANDAGDIVQLQVNTNCPRPNTFNIFKYNPQTKQLGIRYKNEDKCVDNIVGGTIVVSNCNRNTGTQKFDYYPMYDGRFKSTINTSKCLGYDRNSLVVNLQSCTGGTYVLTDPTARQSHLKYSNM